MEWTLWGLLFGPLGLLGAVGLPDRDIFYTRGSANKPENTEPHEKPDSELESSKTGGVDAEANRWS